jgi:DNA-binding transcriptional LysR family regulator
MLKRLSLLIDRERPILRIGMPQAIFFYLFPGVLQRFHDEYDGMELRALERDTMLRELVKDGGLDVCISESFFGDPMVPQQLLGVYQLSLVLPVSWDIEPREENLLDCVKGRPFVTYEPGQTLRNIAVDYLVQSGEDPNIAVSTSGSSSVKRCVEAGLGYAIIPSWCIEPDDDSLKSVVLTGIPPIKVYFGHAQFMRDSIYVRSLYDACRELISPRLLEATR